MPGPLQARAGEYSQQEGCHAPRRDKDLFFLRQRVIFEMAAGDIPFVASSARYFVRCLQKAGASSLEALVATVGSTAPQIAASLVWEGMGDGGTPDPYVGRLRKNGEPLVDMRERFLLAGFAQGLGKAQKAEAAAAPARGPEEGQGAAGPDIPGGRLQGVAPEVSA